MRRTRSVLALATLALAPTVSACGGGEAAARTKPPAFRQRMTAEEEKFERERTLPLGNLDTPLAVGAQAVPFPGLPQGKPTVVVFYRAAWCPYCVRQLGDLEDSLESLRAAGADLVVVGVDDAAKQRELTAKLELAYPLVPDPDLSIAARWGVRQWNVHAALPATFVLDAKGRVVWRHVAVNPVDRAPLADVLAALRGTGS